MGYYNQLIYQSIKESKIKQMTDGFLKLNRKHKAAT